MRIQGRFGVPRASWWRRLWHRDLSGPLDIRARRLALRSEFPWATWCERRDIAFAERAAADVANYAADLDEALATRLRHALRARAPWAALLTRLAARQPEEQAPIGRLARLLVPGAVYEAEDIYEAIGPTSRRGFEMLLYALLCEDVLRSHLVIVDPDGEVLGRYETLDQVPDAVTTPDGDVVRAGFGTVRVKYVVHGRGR